MPPKRGKSRQNAPPPHNHSVSPAPHGPAGEPQPPPPPPPYIPNPAYAQWWNVYAAQPPSHVNFLSPQMARGSIPQFPHPPYFHAASDAEKLRVAVRLLSGSARDCWEDVKAKSTETFTWKDFVDEFNNEYYNRYDRKKKVREFIELTQGDMSVAEYETNLKRLARHEASTRRNDQLMNQKLKQGLNLEIKQQVPILVLEDDFRKCVDTAQNIEDLLEIKKKLMSDGVGSSKKKEKFNSSSRQSSKKIRSTSSSSLETSSVNYGVFGEMGLAKGSRQPLTRTQTRQQELAPEVVQSDKSQSDVDSSGESQYVESHLSEDDEDDDKY
ncbi:Retrotransposon gag protein [Corchorus capsularis]|uniref:Retrotransposon gag protein n=1 Tax=Corchorus capsularis TaxID=210143 RepID=A0A1R3FXI2_COCAP|nr:Retrotransposon gag protein [Corchorus capsularis]